MTADRGRTTSAALPTGVRQRDCDRVTCDNVRGTCFQPACRCKCHREPPEPVTAALTFPQRRALGELLRATVGRSAKSIYTRSDVLWRLEERGLVARNLHNEWRITPAGERAYQAYFEGLR